jgi:hypothetical protein
MKKKTIKKITLVNIDGGWTNLFSTWKKGCSSDAKVFIEERNVCASDH